MKKKGLTKHTVRNHIINYGIHIWIILLLINLGFLYITKFNAKGQTCFTNAQVSSDNRCLYVLNGKVYEKGSRTSPHRGHPCGSDVSSTIPSFHTNSPASYLDPTYLGDVCTVAPTAVPTQVPTQVPTLQPSIVPSAVCLGTSCTPSTSPSVQQPSPTAFAEISPTNVVEQSPAPTQTDDDDENENDDDKEENNGKGGTRGNKGGFFAFILALLAALLQFLKNLMGN